MASHGHTTHRWTTDTSREQYVSEVGRWGLSTGSYISQISYLKKDQISETGFPYCVAPSYDHFLLCPCPRRKEIGCLDSPSNSMMARIYTGGMGVARSDMDDFHPTTPVHLQMCLVLVTVMELSASLSVLTSRPKADYLRGFLRERRYTRGKSTRDNPGSPPQYGGVDSPSPNKHLRVPT